MPPKPRPIVNTHQVYNSSNPPPKKSTPVKATLINQPQISIPNVSPPVITPPVITPSSIMPKITLPSYSGSSVQTSYPTIQKQPETLSASTDQIQEENILKKYPQLLLFIPLILIILSINK